MMLLFIAKATCEINEGLLQASRNRCIQCFVLKFKLFFKIFIGLRNKSSVRHREEGKRNEECTRAFFNMHVGRGANFP